jgi:hypothetical protein
MRTTGPILAIGAITMFNAVVLHKRPIDMRVPLATAASALVFAGLEEIWADGAVGLAWVALVTTLVVPVDKSVPSPVESASAWWSTSSPTAAPKFRSV